MRLYKRYLSWFLFLKTCLQVFSNGFETVQKDLSKCTSGGIADLFPGSFWSPCFQCVCSYQDGRQSCKLKRVTCPTLKCIRHESRLTKCCKVCKGCNFAGKTYNDREVWQHPKDPCLKHTCREGIITQAREQCHTNCNNPITIPGQCCPVCQGCVMDGKSLREGEEVSDPKSPCVTCKCQNNTVSCERKRCPILPCVLKSSAASGSCCKSCDRSVALVPYLPEKNCLVRGVEVENGKSMKVDRCTNCYCMNGTTFCSVITCLLNPGCKKENLVYTSRSCCPQCKEHVTCKYMGKTYKNNESWYLKGCVECKCKDGRNYCRRQICCKAPKPCPKGMVHGFVVGSCCRQCIKKRSTCVTFGDPHYRTFDGKFYSFQGVCKYILTKDCRNNNFSIIVRNSARYTSRFSWTKSVTLKFRGVSISLHQRLKVRVNGQRIHVPFLIYPILDIRQTKRYVFVHTNFGLSITWDGNSYLAVSMPQHFKGSLCGLCGNYNDNPHDDLRLPNGLPARYPQTFANNWRLEASKKCQKTARSLALPMNRCRGWKLYFAHKMCAMFRDWEIKKCHRVVNPSVYFQSCVFDACECPMNGRCECGAVKAYIGECKRKLRGEIKWKREEICDSSCSGGSVYTTCGPACKPTCVNYRTPHYCRKPCVPGCHCPAGYVWHQEQCIIPYKCPR